MQVNFTMATLTRTARIPTGGRRILEMSTSLHCSSARYSPTNCDQVTTLLKNIPWLSSACSLKPKLFNLAFKALAATPTFSVHTEILYTPHLSPSS